MTLKRIKYNFVYQTKNLVNNKTYIGIHTSYSLNDGYIGCGIKSQNSAERRKIQNKDLSCFPKAVVKYGYHNFKREILCFFDTYDECLEEEAWLVNGNWVKSKDNYNIALGGIKVSSRSGKENHMSVAIIGYDKNGNYVGTYESINEAAEKLGLNSKSIAAVFRGEYAAIKGYRFFKFSNDTDVFKNIGIYKKELPNLKYLNKKFGVEHPNAVEIIGYDKDGNLLGIWPTSYAASAELGIKRQNISASANRGSVTKQGYKFFKTSEL